MMWDKINQNKKTSYL